MKSNKEKCGTLDLKFLQDKDFQVVASEDERDLEGKQSFPPSFSVSCSPRAGRMDPWALNETRALPGWQLAHAVNLAGKDQDPSL